MQRALAHVMLPRRMCNAYVRDGYTRVRPSLCRQNRIEIQIERESLLSLTEGKFMFCTTYVLSCLVARCTTCSFAPPEPPQPARWKHRRSDEAHCRCQRGDARDDHLDGSQQLALELQLARR